MTYFFQNLHRHGDRIALIEGDVELSYFALAKQVEEKARAIQAEMEQTLSEAKTCAVTAERPAKHLCGMVAENTVASVVNYLALLSLNYPILFLSETQFEAYKSQPSKDENADIFEAYKIGVVLQEENVHTLPLNEGGSHDDEANTLQNIQENIALLLSTSGSTGTSKQVVLSYDNLQANCDSICAYLPIAKTDVTITTLPFNYSYGLSIINTHLAVGASIVMTTLSMMQREFWHLIEQHQVSSFGGVPHSYDMLLRLKFTSMELPSLRYFTQAGGKLSADRVKQLANYAVDNHKSFFVMYGQTEATARMAYADHTKLLEKAETIGQAIPNTTLRLQGGGHDGELIFCGDNVMLGYAETLGDLSSMHGLNELRTGDLAYQDDEGDFFITGRSKRIVKLFGERLSLDALQSDLLRIAQTQAVQDKVDDVFCVGDDKQLHVVLLQHNLATQNNAESDISITAMKQHMRELKLHPSAIKYHLINQAPLTPNGKLDYPGLYKSIQDGNLNTGFANAQSGVQP